MIVIIISSGVAFTLLTCFHANNFNASNFITKAK